MVRVHGLKDYLIDRIDGICPGFKYLIDFDWEVEKGYSNKGKGDLIFGSDDGVYLIIETKFLHPGSGRNARVHRHDNKRKAKEQAKKYREHATFRFGVEAKVIGATFTNEDYQIHFLDDVNGGFVVIALLVLFMMIILIPIYLVNIHVDEREKVDFSLVQFLSKKNNKVIFLVNGYVLGDEPSTQLLSEEGIEDIELTTNETQFGQQPINQIYSPLVLQTLQPEQRNPAQSFLVPLIRRRNSVRSARPGNLAETRYINNHKCLSRIVRLIIQELNTDVPATDKQSSIDTATGSSFAEI
ncbi:hypothetical protein Glove_668g23 [Diversispora epigaea]|uniref:Uncharacterized protein n=1 Tax=Diversispora epigaea TaxID=1348612 RepID=A0A397GBY7_9GLOM|nr:hypothetical protein Glove_668g23 [Diversispora epigaea]